MALSSPRLVRRPSARHTEAMEVVVELVPAEPEDSPPGWCGTGPAGRFDHLPPPVHLEDTITSADTVVRSGPDLQRDPEREFMLRYAIL